MGSFWSQVMYIPSDHELMKPNWEPVYTLHSQNYYFCIYHTIACGTAHCMIIISITNLIRNARNTNNYLTFSDSKEVHEMSS